MSADTLMRDLYRAEKNEADYLAPMRTLAGRARSALIDRNLAECEIQQLFAEHFPGSYVENTPVIDMTRGLFELNARLRGQLEDARDELRRHEEVAA